MIVLSLHLRLTPDTTLYTNQPQPVSSFPLPTLQLQRSCETHHSISHNATNKSGAQVDDEIAATTTVKVTMLHLAVTELNKVL